jgi:hypothetical protein
MELLSNFMLETAPSLDTKSAIGLDLMRTMMPIVLSAPYLLLQVLALSALHVSHMKPLQADTYHAEATSLQIEALTSVDSYLRNINSSNCEAMLLFSSFLGIHALGEAVKMSKNDISGFLDRFVTYLNLHRGVKSVTSQAWAALLQSKISPVLREASGQLSIAAAQTPARAMLVTDHLHRLLDSADMSAENDTACRNAVSQLTLMYQADFLEDQASEVQRPSSGLIWAWPILLSNTYTDLLQRRQPEALVILCYYAVLLHQHGNMWFVGSAGHMLIESVTKALGSYWRHWLDWPNEVIRESLVN